jgi:hypothetical protein
MSSFLGVVNDNKFQPLGANSSLDSSVRLTHISMVAGASPESDEIDLTEYEGNAIMVEGTPSGSWIFDAEVVDVAGAILTEVVKTVFNQKVAI